MRTQARLCHIDERRCVVEVMVIGAEGVIASALGQGADAESAEDRALSRLQQRLDAIPAPPAATPPAATASTPVPPPAPAPTAAPVPVPAPVPAAPEPEPPSEAPTDPEDWSDELAAIDLELQRLGWDRQQERLYLERAFGHGSRHRLTRYSDLVAFLKRLRSLEPGISADSAPVPLRRSDLISQGDQMLQTLRWSSGQARDFLQQHLQASSRQQLSDEQLLQFNMLLEEQLLALTPSPGSPSPQAAADRAAAAG
ncbi:hypothetical protein SynWH8101_1130 [Synechococcus sp. WH 8101]|uniref:hypothetical protein n=1 Tax=Synechococcus sp. WH 8101 TaxID=59932 RepID=UPI001022E913|nr:hypothetical protein [Synechococcus sp. WH 8101]QBE68718.1 hypothetical protein SynWH8101_1130 [Synechococcus sp. WH 8101]QNI44939.1 hypothetical protein SynRCC2555_01153 [Synechococcus sp. WH 8101]